MDHSQANFIILFQQHIYDSVALGNDKSLEGYSRDPRFDQTRWGIRKTKNILSGYGIWLLPGKWNSPKFGAWDARFFRLFVENSGNRQDPNKRPSNQSRWCFLSNQTIECAWLIANEPAERKREAVEALCESTESTVQAEKISSDRKTCL